MGYVKLCAIHLLAQITLTKYMIIFVGGGGGGEGGIVLIPQSVQNILPHFLLKVGKLQRAPLKNLCINATGTI